MQCEEGEERCDIYREEQDSREEIGKNDNSERIEEERVEEKRRREQRSVFSNRCSNEEAYSRTR
jgi:hypothetical protein